MGVGALASSAVIGAFGGGGPGAMLLGMAKPSSAPAGLTRTKTKGVNFYGIQAQVPVTALKGGSSPEAIGKTLGGEAQQLIKRTKYGDVMPGALQSAINKAAPNPLRYVDDKEFIAKRYGSGSLAGKPVYKQTGPPNVRTAPTQAAPRPIASSRPASPSVIRYGPSSATPSYSVSRPVTAPIQVPVKPQYRRSATGRYVLDEPGAKRMRGRGRGQKPTILTSPQGDLGGGSDLDLRKPKLGG